MEKKKQSCWCMGHDGLSGNGGIAPLILKLGTKYR